MTTTTSSRRTEGRGWPSAAPAIRRTALLRRLSCRDCTRITHRALDGQVVRRILKPCRRHLAAAWRGSRL